MQVDAAAKRVACLSCSKCIGKVPLFAGSAGQIIESTRCNPASSQLHRPSVCAPPNQSNSSTPAPPQYLLTLTLHRTNPAQPSPARLCNAKHLAPPTSSHPAPVCPTSHTSRPSRRTKCGPSRVPAPVYCCELVTGLLLPSTPCPRRRRACRPRCPLALCQQHVCMYFGCCCRASRVL